MVVRRESNPSLYGIPDGGKTVLTSVIIDHLESTFSGQDGVGVAYYFCDFHQEHTILGIYSAILRQLLQQKASIPGHASALHHEYLKHGVVPSDYDTFEALLVMTSATEGPSLSWMHSTSVHFLILWAV